MIGMQRLNKNPVLAYIKQEIEVGKVRLVLVRLQTGLLFDRLYRVRKLLVSNIRDLLLVFPSLVENKNRVKQAKVAVSAAESREADRKQQFYSQLQSLYNGNQMDWK